MQWPRERPTKYDGLTCDDVMRDVLRQICEVGEKCPPNIDLQNLFALWGIGTPGISTLISRLAKAGHFSVEIYSDNWRVIEFMEDGKAIRSEEPPRRAGGKRQKPYRVIDIAGNNFTSTSANHNRGYDPKRQAALTLTDRRGNKY